MNAPLLASALVASLVGSLHCAGMCGPIAMLASPARTLRASLSRLLAYNGSRIAGYAILGALAGALGAALDLGGAFFGLQRVALIVSGVALVLSGLVLLLGALGLRVPVRVASSGLGRTYRSLHQRIARLGPITRAAGLGAASALLPCGWLYAFVVAAAGTGSALHGALLMIAFGLGSVPTLAIVALSAHGVRRPWPRSAPIVAAVLLIVVGGTFLGGRLRVPGLKVDAATAPDAVPSIESTDLPCCHDDGD